MDLREITGETLDSVAKLIDLDEYLWQSTSNGVARQWAFRGQANR